MSALKADALIIHVEKKSVCLINVTMSMFIPGTRVLSFLFVCVFACL